MRKRHHRQSNKERRIRLQIARINLINQLYLRIIHLQCRTKLRGLGLLDIWLPDNTEWPTSTGMIKCPEDNQVPPTK